MKRALGATVLALCMFASAEGVGPFYYERFDFLLAPPAAFGDGLVGFAQPATLTFLERAEAQLHWSTTPGRLSGFSDWAFVLGVPHLGFAMQTRKAAGFTAREAALSLGVGSPGLSFGTQYGWGGGDRPPEPWVALGSVWRPGRYTSFSLSGRYAVEGPDYEWVGEAGLRPLGDRRVTLFADLAWVGRTSLSEAPWSAGAALQMAPGLDLLGRYFDRGAFTVSARLNFGHAGVSTQSHVDAEGEYAQQSWSVRLGGLRPGIAGRAADRRFVALHPRGRVRYLTYEWFDSAPRLYHLLADIRAAAADSRVAALALNLSGVSLSPEHAWEVREALREAQDRGTQVLVFIDKAGMSAYHLASVADRVVLDPYGTLLLPGYALHKTYFRGTLEKLGLGFDEWRYYRYKSAAETLVQDSMSEADREQTQAFVDDWYEVTARDVCASRGLSRPAFDSLVDEEVFLTAARALSLGLVDTLARWSERGALIARHTGRPLAPLSSGSLLERAEVRDEWGEPPRLALVYGLGVCDMDEGIGARRLERVFRQLGHDPRVKAVVFRVDSPGGDPLASDLVAAAVKECSRQKPVIVSQGQVAASGGYWLSMAADSILAGPTTVTGSIGVIGGWLYDRGLASRLGMSSDVAKRGRHADYNAGIRLPLLGTRLPRQPLSAEQTQLVGEVLADLYLRFVEGVAEHRGLSADSVGRLAEGRIFSGEDANSAGLVDGIGGLLVALDWAALKAGLEPGSRPLVVEYPERAGWINWPWRSPAVTSGVPLEDWEQALRLLAEFNGQPLTLLAPGHYPEAE